jgi:hypothetical protein
VVAVVVTTMDVVKNIMLVAMVAVDTQIQIHCQFPQDKNLHIE